MTSDTLMLREAYPVPPDVRLDEGAWCPLDDHLLDPSGLWWACGHCGAAWDVHGRGGWWMPRADAEVMPPPPAAAVRPVLADRLLAGGVLAGVAEGTVLDLAPQCAVWALPLGVLVYALVAAWVVGRQRHRCASCPRDEFSGGAR